MPKTVSILQPQDIVLLRRAHEALSAFLAAPEADRPAPKPPVAAKKKRPTGAAAHKDYLAKKAKAKADKLAAAKKQAADIAASEQAAADPVAAAS